MKKILLSLVLFTLSCVYGFAQDDFVLGADMGWLTQYESSGKKFYDRAGVERECMSIMADYGITAQRIRVWVDPSKHGGWCDKNDVLKKALRAKELGQEVMIDFHYSDWWADPAKQNIPDAWKSLSFKKMKKALADHTIDVLTLLKQNGVSPRWVQVGNETSGGMLWPMGKLPDNPKKYAGFIRAGYDAVKSVFPEALVLVHLDNGFDNKLYNYNLDIIKKYGGRFDMIGMSIYPYWSMKDGREPTAEKTINDCITNINLVARKYGVDVMITETGFEVDEAHPEVMECGRDQLRMLIKKCRTLTFGRCRGVFYWEPECRPSQYKLGAFTEDGHPTVIMNGFMEHDPEPIPVKTIEPVVPEANIVSTDHQLYTHAEMMQDLDSLALCFPDIISVCVADTTYEGRAIPFVRFGAKDAPYRFLVSSTIHAREYINVQLVLAMLEYYARGYKTLKCDGVPISELFDSVAIDILPMINPDGVAIAQQGADGAVRPETKDWVKSVVQKGMSHERIKANGNGVDLNRNFGNGFGKGYMAASAKSFEYYSGPSPYSEIESQMLMRITRENDYLCFLNYHSKGNNVYYGCMNADAEVNGAARSIANLVKRFTGYPLYGEKSSVPNGSWADEVEVRYKRPSVTIEVGTVTPVPISQFPGIYSKNLPLWPALCMKLLKEKK